MYLVLLKQIFTNLLLTLGQREVKMSRCGKSCDGLAFTLVHHLAFNHCEVLGIEVAPHPPKSICATATLALGHKLNGFCHYK